LPFAFNMPELANTGFSLDGGRLIYLRQQPGAELLLHYGLHRCSLFIFQDGPAFSRAISGIHNGPFHVEMQRQNGLIFFVIGDLDQDVIQKLGTSFAAAQ
jgi:anti-sigma factor RsiW